ncbi:DUF7561 family protein [Halosegnis marinus]|uniref:Small CPxCG-related zinc finger protein n=1 Tax=Halosegnis marinus TaxID=3034023 RepID=A0ABD5ZN66_9EURY|nr:hypothetical protein [Halosegnis sp. DT85]
MASEPCDGCGRKVTIAGGIANIWTFGGDETDGLALELADGTDHLLCYDCIERLPDEATAADVAALAE